jgi:hypothetical protein
MILFPPFFRFSRRCCSLNGVSAKSSIVQVANSKSTYLLGAAVAVLGTACEQMSLIGLRAYVASFWLVLWVVCHYRGEGSPLMVRMQGD